MSERVLVTLTCHVDLAKVEVYMRTMYDGPEFNDPYPPDLEAWVREIVVENIDDPDMLVQLPGLRWERS